MHLKISSCLFPGKMHVEEIQSMDTNIALKVLRCVGKAGGINSAGITASEKLSLKIQSICTTANSCIFNLCQHPQEKQFQTGVFKFLNGDTLSCTN